MERSRSRLDDLSDPLPVPSGGVISGSLTPPGSKSVSNRALNLALLSESPTQVENLLVAEDLEVFLSALEGYGFGVASEGRRLLLTPPKRPRSGARFDCGAGGTMFRFVVAALTTREGSFVVDGTARLRQRPIAPLVDALRQLGAQVEYLEREGCAPLQVVGPTLDGGRCRLDAGESSQFLSALLMASLRAGRRVEIEVESLTSGAYVEITLEMVNRWAGHRVVRRGSTFIVDPLAGDPPGARSEPIVVEADFSAAAYPAAAAVLTGGEVELCALRRDSTQGDRYFLELLQRVGATVEHSPRGIVVRGGSAIKAIEVDMSEIPDQVPTMAAVACFARGTTRIHGVPHLRLKESDRLHAMVVELSKADFEVKELDDGLLVRGGPRSLVRGPVVTDAHDDHRIAMSLALVGLRRPGISVAAPQVVAKSYPDFWSDLDRLLGQPVEQ